MSATRETVQPDKRKACMVRLEPDVYQRVKEKSDRERRSMSQQLALLVDEGLRADSERDVA